MKVIMYSGYGINPGGGVSRYRGLLRPDFQGPPDNADELNAKMSDIVGQLQSAYAAAHQAIVNAHGTGFVDVLTGASATYDETLAAFEGLQQYITQLDGDLRQAVLSGENQGGNPYTYDQWVAFAKGNVADAISKIAGYSIDASGWNIISNTAGSLNPFNVNSPLNPSNWPWYVWVGAAGLALAAAGPVINLAAAALGRRRAPAS